MIAQRGQQKELIIYWFQSYDQTNLDTLSQKISSLWGKILNNREDNAFVRITVSIGDRPVEECKEVAFRFIRAFYPTFLNHIVSNEKRNE